MTVKIKLFKPEDHYTDTDVDNFIKSHFVYRIETFPHANKAGAGHYVALTYKENEYTPNSSQGDNTDTLAKHMYN
jgi:hypothetical protein